MTAYAEPPAVAEGLLLYQQDGPVATITFNRPESRNSMTFPMYDALYDLCERAEADPSVRVVVLTGAGDRSFISGTDIHQFQAFKTADDALQYEQRISRALGRVEALTKPSIALLQGDAVGAGLFLSLMCDVRLAAEHIRFGAPIARTLGNFPAPANFLRLGMAIGLYRAKRIVLTAELLSASEAARIGLADEVLPASQLAARCHELATRMAAHAPLTMSGTKEAVRRVLNATPLQAEDLFLACYTSADFHEGVNAFLEKRPANWQGQ